MKSKTLTIILGSLGFIVAIVLFFASTIVRNYINKHGEAMIGRKIELQQLNFNYFRVAVKARGFVMFETNKVDTFAGFNELYVNFDPWKLLDNEYSFSSIHLDSIYTYIIQDSADFNFNDLIRASDSIATQAQDSLPSSPIRFSIYNIRLTRGKLDFYDRGIDNRLVFDDLELNLPKIAWNSQKSEVGADFEFGEKGHVVVGADVNNQLNTYHISVKMNSMALAPVSNYAEQYLDVEGLSGWFNADMDIRGSLTNTSDVVISGHSSVDSLRLWEADDTDILSMREARVSFDSLDLGRNVFHFGQIRLDQPVLTATLDKGSSNIERVLRPLLEVDSTAVERDQGAGSDSVKLSYLIDSINVNKAMILFSDNTLNRPFNYDFKDINVRLQGIGPSASAIPLTFYVNLNDEGNFHGESTLSLADPFDFSVRAQLEKMRLMSFSPYTEYYLTRPITKGAMNYDFTLDMNRSLMQNTNTVLINELEFGAKTPDTTGIKAPILLGLYLMKDPNDQIKIDLPVKGNPSDPDFNVGKIIWKAFANLLVKAASSPFNLLGNLISTQPEELEFIPFDYARDSLVDSQKATLDKIASILEKKPKLAFSFTQLTHPDKEKDSLAIYLAKKQMLVEKINPHTEKQYARFHEQMSRLTAGDKDFIHYLNKHVEGADTMRVLNACRKLIGEAELEEAFTQLINNRSTVLEDYLIRVKQVDSASVEIVVSDFRNIPEELKSPQFDVEVSIK